MSSSDTQQPILVGVDGSEHSQRALQVAAKLATDLNAPLILVSAIDWSVPGIPTDAVRELARKAMDEEAERVRSILLTPIMRELQAKGLHVSIDVEEGSPLPTLLMLIERHQPRMAVIGRRGQSRFQALLFGSVAAGLSQTSPVPVLVVP